MISTYLNHLNLSHANARLCKMNAEDLYVAIANKATFLAEKLNRKSFENHNSLSENHEQLRTLWESSLQEGDNTVLSQRLKSIGIEKEYINHIFDSTTYHSINECPKWIFIFDEICQYYSDAKDIDNIEASFIHQESPFPFEEIIVPVVLFIRNKCKGYRKLFSKKAEAHMERSILASLSGLLAPCLYLESYSVSEKEGNHYKNFVNQFIAPENGPYRLHFFGEYAVLARILVSEVNNWIDFLTFLSKCVDEDYEILKQFIGQESLGLIDDLEIGISDKHNNGKSVVKVIFENGRSVFFKPRNSALESDFYSFISYLNSILPHTLRLRLPTILQRSSYSWVEAIDFRDVTSELKLKKYYKRCGALLCITHLFNGTDFHYENLICDGEFPVLIDTETLLQPRTRKFKKAEFSNEKDLALNSSVLMTLLLPQWQEKDEHSVYDIGGLTAMPGYTGIFEPKWSKINTPEMELSFEEIFVNPQKHKPLSESCSLYHYREPFLKGFKQCHRFILNRKSEILREIEDKKWFHNVLTRVVIRPTKVYAKLIERLKHPMYMRSGVAYGIELEQLLSNAFETELTPDEFRKWLDFYNVECDSLQEMNIPIFHANTNQLHLFSNEKNVFPRCFFESGLDLLKQNLKSRDKKYEKTQTQIIGCSVASRYSEALYSFEIKPSSPLIEPTNYVEIASKIGDQLLDAALQNRDGEICFSGLKYSPLIQKYELEVLDDTFMSGQFGIAFFYACLFDATKRRKYKVAANRCLSPFLKEMQEKNRFRQTSFYLGFDGLGGFIYGFSKIAYYTGDHRYFSYAKKLIEYAKTNYNFDTHLDVVFGLSGLINAIIVYSSLSKDEGYRDFLSLLGGEILKRDYKEWGKELQKTSITGFSHGISGISYSLIRLGEHLNSREYYPSALDALEYESSFYDPKIKGWKDSREFMATGEPKPGIDWAHGATGIGLARCSLPSGQLTDRLSGDIRLVSEGLEGTIHTNEYNLANGVLGVVDFWIRQGNGAKERLNQVLEQLQEQGFFSGFSPMKALNWQPSLFYGAAGLGYQLLRIQNAVRYPSILLFE